MNDSMKRKLEDAKRYLAGRSVRAPIGTYMIPWKPPLRGQPLSIERLRRAPWTLRP